MAKIARLNRSRAPKQGRSDVLARELRKRERERYVIAEYLEKYKGHVGETALLQPVDPRPRHAQARNRAKLLGEGGGVRYRLSDAEQANVMAALRFLRRRSGTWRLLASALGVEPCTIRNIKKGLKGVSVNIAFRVSRLACVPFDDVVEGRYPVKGTCPHCGHVGKSAIGVNANSQTQNLQRRRAIRRTMLLA